MERNYSETLNKAKSYFKNMIKERENYMQQLTLDLPKRIEIQTLPLSAPKDDGIYTKVEKFNKPDNLGQKISESPASPKPKSEKKKPTNNHAKSPHVKIESFDLRNMNTNSELKTCKNRSSSNTVVESLSLSTSDSPVSASVKISASSSTQRINQKCQEAIEKAKSYFQTREKSDLTKTPTTPTTKRNSRVNETTSTKAENSIQKPENVINTEIMESAEKHVRRKGKFFSQQKKISCFEVLTPAKKYLRSKLGIDQKSINVKKDKEAFSHSKTHMYRVATKIKSYPSTKNDSKKTVNQKESPQTMNQTNDKTPEPLTPAKRYLRSKLGFDEKSTNTKKEQTKSIQNPLTQDVTANTQTQTQTGIRPESPSKFSAKSNKFCSPVKVRQPTTRIRETNFKKLSAANENYKREKYKSKTAREKGVLSAKTDIVTSIEPNFRETNKISIELKKPIVLTSSMEELLSKALRIGLKKINRGELQDLQLKIKGSVQSRNNISSLVSEKSDLTSMQSVLESKISDFQTEMERRQKHTFDKIQELENTILFRKQQLMEIGRSKTARH